MIERAYPTLPLDIASAVENTGSVVSWKRNQVIFQPGDEVTGLHVMKQGIVYSRRKRESRSYIEHVYRVGQVVGLEAVLSQPNYTTKVVAANDVEVFSLEQDKLRDLIQQYPLYFMQLVTHTIRTVEQLQERFRLPASEQVALSLKEFENEDGLVCVSQSEIAARSGGTSNASVIQALADRGIVWDEITVNRETKTQQVLDAIEAARDESGVLRKTQREIAAMASVGKSTVAAVLKREGLDWDVLKVK